MALGSSVLGLAAMHVLQGNITGDVPENLSAQQREDWLYNADGSTNHQPFSFKLGNKWVSYAGMEPLAFLLGALQLR